MTEHDPFCPGSTNECICVSLGRVRADERERIGAEALLVSIARDTYLRAKVEALPLQNVYSHRGPVVLRADVLALFDAVDNNG